MNIEAQKNNILLELHMQFSELPVMFRERVCEECNYSVPTFHRKIRGNVIQALSKAEREMIRCIGEELANELFNTVFGDNKK